jgi:hypothetical protein
MNCPTGIKVGQDLVNTSTSVLITFKIQKCIVREGSTRRNDTRGIDTSGFETLSVNLIPINTGTYVSAVVLRVP